MKCSTVNGHAVLGQFDFSKGDALSVSSLITGHSGHDLQQNVKEKCCKGNTVLFLILRESRWCRS